MNIEQHLTKLQDLNAKLDNLTTVLSCPVVSESLRVKHLELQYEYFMEFIGTYEDIEKYINEMETSLDKARYKKILKTFWRQDVV